MIGLQYIAQTFRIQFAEIANELGVNKSTVNDWLKGKRKIPIKRLKQLAEYFKLKEEYFQKELSDVEELEIMKQNVIRHSHNEDRKETFVDELGNKHTIINSVNDSAEIIRLINQKQKRASLLESISKLIQVNDGYENRSFFEDLVCLLEDGSSRRLVLLLIGAVTPGFGTTYYVGEQNERESEFTNELEDLLLKSGYKGRKSFSGRVRPKKSS